MLVLKLIYQVILLDTHQEIDKIVYDNDKNTSSIIFCAYWYAIINTLFMFLLKKSAFRISFYKKTLRFYQSIPLSNY